MPQEGGHFDCAYVAAVEPEVQVELVIPDERRAANPNAHPEEREARLEG
jgi:hypothetical protein